MKHQRLDLVGLQGLTCLAAHRLQPSSSALSSFFGTGIQRRLVPTEEQLFRWKSSVMVHIDAHMTVT